MDRRILKFNKWRKIVCKYQINILRKGKKIKHEKQQESCIDFNGTSLILISIKCFSGWICTRRKESENAGISDWWHLSGWQCQ